MARYESLDDVPERYRDVVTAELGEETFLCGTRAADGLLPRTWPRLILTESRLFVVKRGLTRSGRESYPFSSLSTISVDETGSPRLVLTTNDGGRHEFSLEVSDGAEFIHRLQEQTETKARTQ